MWDPQKRSSQRICSCVLRLQLFRCFQFSGPLLVLDDGTVSTHKPLIKNAPESAIFCLKVTCNFQTLCKGSRTMMTSKKISGRDIQRQKASKSIQFP